MKTIGLIGGMSWESSAAYYRLINQESKRRLGGHHNARSLLRTVDFADVELLQHSDAWPQLGALLIDAARSLERGGADFFLICANTPHRLAPEICAAVNIPLLHIADATGQALQRAGHIRAALLGTRFTMEGAFYSDRLRAFGIETVVPPPAARETIHDAIYNELCHGTMRPESRMAYREIIAALATGGAEAVIFGCTEIGLFLTQDDSPIPVFDTTTIHAAAAVDLALA